VQLVYEEISLLFTGDIEMEAINQMMSSVPTSHVLKVAHHGSPGSFNQKFFTAVDPEIVVIQVGKNNSFGHPGKNIIEYLRTRESLFTEMTCMGL